MVVKSEVSEAFENLLPSLKILIKENIQDLLSDPVSKGLKNLKETQQTILSGLDNFKTTMSTVKSEVSEDFEKLPSLINDNIQDLLSDTVNEVFSTI